MRHALLLLSALAGLSSPTVAAPSPRGPWHPFQQFDVQRPKTPEQTRIATLWNRYGIPFGRDMVGHSLIFINLPAIDTEVIIGIALVPGCDMGPNDAASTQLHAVCPGVVMLVDGPSVRTIRIPRACYMWTENSPPSPQTDPRRNATQATLQDGAAWVQTIRNGKPIPGCQARIALPLK